MNNKADKLRITLLSGLTTMVIMIILMVIERIAPFGSNSFVGADADFQYLDMLTFIGNVLRGKDDLFFTHTAGLGMNTIVLFSYYLASPFNLISVFFSHRDAVVLYDTIVFLKIVLSGVFMSMFIVNRRPQIMDKGCLCIILFVSYAVCEYTIMQAINIMWLDGVYMLPLIMLGVWMICDKGDCRMLPVAVAGSLLFNWYTGAINLIFAVVYFVYETLIDNGPAVNFKVKKIAGRCVRFAGSVILGILMSSVLFIPTVIRLLGVSGKQPVVTDMKVAFEGYITDVIQNNVVGGMSAVNSGCVFCGSFVTLLMILFFINKAIAVRERIVSGVLLVLGAMCFCFTPFISLFSLFRPSSSYFYRYSYVIIAFCICIASSGLTYLNRKSFLICSVLWIFILVMLNLIRPLYQMLNVTLTAGFMLVISFLLDVWFQKNDDKRKLIVRMFIFAVAIIELCVNADMLYRIYGHLDGASFTRYWDEKSVTMESLDTETVRINQTVNRAGVMGMNEALSYDYMSVNTYTSCPDDSQMELMSRFGYPVFASCVNITSFSNIPADSLLGVRYIVSDTPVAGLMDTGLSYNGAVVYENPYYLPVAFVSSSMNTQDPQFDGNSFDYINGLYRYITGMDENVFVREYDYLTFDGDSISYVFPDTEDEYPIYASFAFDDLTYSYLHIGELEISGEASYIPDMVYVPRDGREAVLDIESDGAVVVGEAFFYSCDLGVLQQMTDMIRDRSESVQLGFGHNEIICHADSNGEENLIISVPYTDGMTITDNGNVVPCDTFAGCLIEIPLKEGSNDIVISFSCPGLKAGMVVALLGAAVYASLCWYYGNKNKRGGNPPQYVL